MPARRMLLMGYYGAHNLGDDMMLFCLQKWLARQQVSITVLSECPEEIQRSFVLPAVRNVPLLGEWSWVDAWLRGRALRVVRAILGHDGLIVGGGDLIRDDRGWRTFLFTLEKILLAILFRKPVYLVNVGIGRPHTSLGRRLLAWALPRCRKIIVRDQRSLDLCREFHAPAKYAPDIVLSSSVISKSASHRPPATPTLSSACEPSRMLSINSLSASSKSAAWPASWITWWNITAWRLYFFPSSPPRGTTTTRYTRGSPPTCATADAPRCGPGPGTCRRRRAAWPEPAAWWPCVCTPLCWRWRFTGPACGSPTITRWWNSAGKCAWPMPPSPKTWKTWRPCSLPSTRRCLRKPRCAAVWKISPGIA